MGKRATRKRIRRKWWSGRHISFFGLLGSPRRKPTVRLGAGRKEVTSFRNAKLLTFLDEASRKPSSMFFRIRSTSGFVLWSFLASPFSSICCHSFRSRSRPKSIAIARMVEKWGARSSAQI